MKRPSFQFYPADYLSDMQVRMMPWASRGLYMDLLCYCWREGWIPADSSAIAQLCSCHDLAIVEPCLKLFQPHPEHPGKLIHGRLQEEKNKQDEYKKERSESGKKGAERLWEKRKSTKNGSAIGSANGSAINQPMAKNGSSTSISSSTSSKETPPFFSDEFLDAWELWKTHRKQLRKPLTPVMISAQFREFEKWGEPRAIAAITHTVTKGWQGLREPEGQDIPKPKNTGFRAADIKF